MILVRVQMTMLAILAVGCGVSNRARQPEGAAVIINPEISCERCSIAIETVLTIDGSLLNGPVTAIARDSAGSFFLRDGGDGLLKVYNGEGQFLRQIGRRGGGPGEYERVRNILVAPDGTIEVLDQALARRSRFTAAGEFLGSTPFTAVGGNTGVLGMSAVLLADRRIVVNALAATQTDTGAVLQVVDRNGETTPLGESSPIEPMMWWRQERLLWPRPEGGLLVAQPYRFSIDVYAADLRKGWSMSRATEWTPLQDPEEEPSDGMYNRPPTPFLRAIWEEPIGSLWLLMFVPSKSWAAGPAQGELGARERNQAAERGPRYDQIIEVVDLEHRQVLARYSGSFAMGRPVGGGYFLSYVEDSVGGRSGIVSRIQLKR